MSAHTKQLFRPANDERLLNLPDGWKTSVDPVEENPFKVHDKRHKVWAAATRCAEEELRRFKSHYLKLHSSTYNKHRSRAEAEKAVADRTCVLAVGKFDIWAKRGLKVVGTDSAVLDFVKWLDHYAEACLKEIRGWFPASIPIDWVLREVRPKLARQSEWWKGQANRCVADQKPVGDNPPEPTKGPSQGHRSGATGPRGALNYRSEVKRAVALQLTKDPTASDLKICRGLDADGAIEIPSTWKVGGGERLFAAAYRAKTIRPKVEKLISKVRTEMRQRGLLPNRSAS